VAERLTQWLGWSTLVAALAHGLLHLGYSRFYEPLGVSPEEAGVEKSDVLSHALVGPAVLFGVVVVYLFGLLLLVALCAALYAGPVRRGRHLITVLRLAPKRRRSEEDERLLRHSRAELASARRAFVAAAVRPVKWVVLVTVVVAAGFVSYAVYEDSSEAGRRARAGLTVHAPEIPLGFVSLPLLDVRAVPVTIHGTGDVHARFEERTHVDTDCLLYVGTADRSALLFDPTTTSVVRVPVADAVFELAPAGELDDGCRTGDSAG
jgi:hypothetical protein